MIARKIVLPMFNPTEICDENNGEAKRVSLISGDHYFVQPRKLFEERNCRDGKPNMVISLFNLYPVVLLANGSPWPEANMWILSMLEGKVQPNMSSYSSIAEGLSCYLQFIEEHDIKWLEFQSQKLMRPTYRFNGHLKHLIQNQEIEASTAKRYMSVVIRFYRWLKEEGFVPEYPTWKEADRYIEFNGQIGSSQLKKVTTTDVSILVAKQVDPYDRCIQDGGKLRPLTQEEQSWLLDALFFLSNTEMTLIHIFALITGGRIQTILTFRLRHILKEHSVRQSVVRIEVGQGTGIDTKYDKKMVLHIPWTSQTSVDI